MIIITCSDDYFNYNYLFFNCVTFKGALLVQKYVNYKKKKQYCQNVCKEMCVRNVCKYMYTTQQQRYKHTIKKKNTF